MKTLMSSLTGTVTAITHYNNNMILYCYFNIILHITSAKCNMNMHLQQALHNTYGYAISNECPIIVIMLHQSISYQCFI